jgi:predicted 3-demethylubiquinone-9 3-methyltransferase (glyoxalase superfamily)
MAARQRIKTFLWYDDNAEEAVKFYVSLFKNSKILEVARYSDVGPGRKGSVMTIEFQLEGQRFIALNGGPHFKFNEAISLAVDCDTQKEIDRLWSKLTSGGGQESQCGWLKDKFGLSWQINPSVAGKMFADKDPKKVNRAMQAMLQMKKMDIAALKRAFAGK